MHESLRPEFLSELANDRGRPALRTLKALKNLAHLSIFMRFPERFVCPSPLLVLAGEENQISPLAQLLEKFKRWKIRDKRLYVFENGAQELLIGHQSIEAAAVISEWICDKLINAPPFGLITRTSTKSHHSAQPYTG